MKSVAQKRFKAYIIRFNGFGKIRVEGGNVLIIAKECGGEGGGGWIVVCIGIGIGRGAIVIIFFVIVVVFVEVYFGHAICLEYVGVVFVCFR